MMLKKNTETYMVVKNEDGSDFLCPAAPNGKNVRKIDENVCFEKDVPERYAGHITIREP